MNTESPVGSVFDPSPAELRRQLGTGPVHFMGVGGAGMSALAEVVARAGSTVTGCDLHPDPVTSGRLEIAGVPVAAGHEPEHVERSQLVVASAAVREDHPELERARRLGVPVVSRAQALAAWISKGRVLAVAGTHGKTTTTALATEILREAGLQPTGFVGGRVASWGSNLHAGGEDLFVVEADEYARSFLKLDPQVAVVTNVEADHLDVYGDLAALREAFQRFLGRVAPDGQVVVCFDDPGARELASDMGREAYGYGLGPEARLRGTDVELGPSESRFTVMEDGEARGRFRLPLPGAHNVRNALGAAAAARFLGAEWEAVERALDGFQGVGRRFEALGAQGGIDVVDDYAHHPTEVTAALQAARSRVGDDGRLVAVFQPHLYSRTRDFQRAFGEALAAADVVWVCDVYPAREAPIPGISGEVVARAARDAGASAVHYHADLESLAEAVAGELRAGDLCITMGAGSIEKLGPRILQEVSRE